MNRGEIIEKINTILEEEFEVEIEDASPEDNFKDTLDLDSLDYVDLVVVIEEHFGFKLVADDFVGVESVQDFYDLIEKKLAN